MKILKNTLLPALLITGILFPQSKEKSVANAGKRDISVTEFVERYEMTPWNKQIRNIPENIAKEEFLYTLIAEKLWAQKAVELGMDTSYAVRQNLKSLEKLFVKDALYRMEIMNKVKITDADMKQAYKKAHLQLKGDFLAGNSQNEINELYMSLKQGISFDTLFSARHAAGLSDTLSIFLGKFHESLEDSLYNLQPGSYTHPFFFGGAWYIVRILKSNPVLPKTAKEEDFLVKETGRILKERQTGVYFDQFTRKFFSGKQTSINGPVLKTVSDQIISLIQSKFTSGDTSKVFLSPADFMTLRKNLENRNLLKSPIIRFEDQVSLVSEFLDNFNYNENSFSASDAKKLKGIIDRKLKNFMESEYLAYEGYKRGLQNLPEVKNQIQIWKDSYMYLALRNAVADSFKVSDREVEEYYAKHKNAGLSEQVNIVEVLTDNLEVVEKVLNELSQGTEMRELARKYSKREMTRNTSGEFGFFNVTDFGEIGRIAATMEVGDVYGPLKTQEGFSVFKLIDKKKSAGQKPRPFQEVKEQIRRTLSGLKNYHGLVNYTVRLAHEYGVTINKEVLNSLNVTNIFSIMYRNIGFGGRILAAPLTSPNTDWVKPWQNALRENL